jgi:signal peptidase I
VSLLADRPWKRAAIALAIGGAAWLINDTWFFESVVIPSSSMVPAILPNERIFLARFPPPAIRRFDIVVIKSRNYGERIAKRVMAVPGERVRLEASWRVFINGESLTYSDENAAHERIEAGDHAIRTVQSASASFATQFAAHDLVLGPDEYFVLGDNRLASEDSRAIGPVTRAEIQGTLGIVWYSYDCEHHRWRVARLLHALR